MENKNSKTETINPSLIDEDLVFFKVQEYKNAQSKQKAITKQIKALKDDILKALEILDKKKLKNEKHEVSIAYPKSFDQGLLKLDNRELYDRFTTIETITTETETFDRKEFQKRFPKEYEKYLVELTPRLTVK